MKAINARTILILFMHQFIFVLILGLIVRSPACLVSWLMIPRCYTILAGEPDVGVPRVGS